MASDNQLKRERHTDIAGAEDAFELLSAHILDLSDGGEIPGVGVVIDY